MPLFELKSLSKSCGLEDAAADYRTACRAGQYRLSGEALYFPAFPGTRYLPFAALTQAWSKNTAMSVKGCCGKELPMVRVRLFYDGTFYQDFLFETLAEADVVLDKIRSRRPDLPLERETAGRRAV